MLCTPAGPPPVEGSAFCPETIREPAPSPRDADFPLPSRGLPSTRKGSEISRWPMPITPRLRRAFGPSPRDISARLNSCGRIASLS